MDSSIDSNVSICGSLIKQGFSEVKHRSWIFSVTGRSATFLATVLDKTDFLRELVLWKEFWNGVDFCLVHSSCGLLYVLGSWESCEEILFGCLVVVVTTVLFTCAGLPISWSSGGMLYISKSFEPSVDIFLFSHSYLKKSYRVGMYVISSCFYELVTF